MPNHYLKSQPPPDKPVDDWLLWSESQLESHINDPSKKIAGILGINKAGDLQHIFMPTIVPKAIGNASAVLGNSMDASSEPAFVYLDISDLGYTSVIEHLAWAKLVKENITQQENDGQDYEKILSRISKGDEDTVSKYVTPNTFGVELLDAPIIQVFSLPKNKWSDAQEKLRSFFKCNPSPTRQPRSSLTSPVSSPIGVTFFANNTQAAPPVVLPNATASQQTTANNQPPPFDPMSFMQQFATQMMTVQQRSQTIVVESREDKSRESEAKFNNNMLRLLLVGGTIDFTSPGSFIGPCIAKYTQAMKNILLQPTSVRSILTVNILTRHGRKTQSSDHPQVHASCLEELRFCPSQLQLPADQS